MVTPEMDQVVAPQAGERARVERVIEAGAKRDLTWLWVLLLTAAAGVLRFWALDRPPIWLDEAAVYWRTCGTFRQLLDILQGDGFVPLHYEMNWVIARFGPLTLRELRFVPALAGVLMVPAMYWLARELVSRRAALATAAFAAVSAHIGWYARDAKMYMHMWLMCVVSTAALLWWRRSGQQVAWLVWVAAGLAAVGLQSLAWGVIGVQVVMVLVVRGWRHRGAVVGLIVGLMVIGAGPAGYYLGFNRWTQKIRERGWDAGGIGWIQGSNQGQTPPQLVAQAGNHYLFGIDFRPSLSVLCNPDWGDWGTPVVQWLPTGLVAALVIGLFPWPWRRRALGEERPPQAWWRSAICVAAWMLVPPYAFYCASFSGYAWPTDMVLWLANGLRASRGGLAVVAVMCAAALYCCDRSWRGRLLGVVRLAGVVAVLLLLGTGIAWWLEPPEHRPPGPVWTSRYIGIVWPAVAIVVGTLVMRLPWAPLRWTVLGLLLALNLGQCVWRAAVRMEPPLREWAGDVLASQGPTSTVRTYNLNLPREGIPYDLPMRYYLFAARDGADSPDEFMTPAVGSVFHLEDAAAPAQVVELVRGVPARVNRVVVWDTVGLSKVQLDDTKGPFASGDELMPQLAGWGPGQASVYPFYSRWSPSGQQAWRRREYIRVPASGPTHAQ
jgi:4-amino-4-deoxy-L-arabinose transferase-like glycosyltransferase